MGVAPCYLEQERQRFEARALRSGVPPRSAGRAWQGMSDIVLRKSHTPSSSCFEPFQERMAGADGRSMALWCGGSEACIYAANAGFWTLESCPFYQLTDGLLVDLAWGRVSPLWAVFSRQFVDSGRGAVHCFLRSYRSSSILATVELPTLLARRPGTRVWWHALARVDGIVFELDRHGNPRPRGRGAPLSSLDEAIAALRACKRLYPTPRLRTVGR